MTRHVVLVLALALLAGDVYPAKSMPTKEQPLNDEHVSPDVEKAEVLLEELEELLDKEVMANNNGGDDDDDQMKRDFEPTDSCPTGWSSYGARCYQVFIGQRTFPEAVEFCESENARVALPKDQGINDHIVALRNSDSVAQQTSCWIGLEHEEVEGEHIYRWTDGELLGNYTNWATDPPEPNHAPGDADCVRMERNVPTSPGVSNQWRDFPCDDLLAVCVICEAGKYP
ncbi:PREDICTED: echinoidin-like [Branchiostoma belcheri]|uniref:Echinoidin-like n=1 Tax=Branchiostoma belcheri TaxID=7741 RepID=A0A6P4Z2R2_BRABE|nr:PREDICTED: echinoidin-like [Branchiostoma belcheri]